MGYSAWVFEGLKQDKRHGQLKDRTLRGSRKLYNFTILELVEATICSCKALFIVMD